MILVDSNVLLDIFTNDPQWYSWSSEKIQEYAEQEALAINPIIYAEISIAYSSSEELDEMLPSDQFQRLDLPYEGGFLAGKCFNEYKKRRGFKQTPLPDFYIGAHAITENLTLLTRDLKRYRTYFPKIKLIVPGNS